MKTATFWQRLWNSPLTAAGAILLGIGLVSALVSTHDLLRSSFTEALAILFPLAGVGLLVFVGWRAWTLVRLADSGMETVGTVTYIQRIEPSKEENFVWYIHFAFTDHKGVIREAHTDAVPRGVAESWRPGDKGLVRYDEKRPHMNLWIGRP